MKKIFFNLLFAVAIFSVPVNAENIIPVPETDTVEDGVVFIPNKKRRGLSEHEIPQSALLFFIPELSDRDISFIGSVSIEAYEKSNMKYENKEGFYEQKLLNDWTEYSYKTSIFVYDGEKRIPIISQENVRMKVLKYNVEDGVYLCLWTCLVDGSLCSYSGGFIFSVIKRPVLFEGERVNHHFIVYLGSLSETEYEKEMLKSPPFEL